AEPPAPYQPLLALQRARTAPTPSPFEPTRSMPSSLCLLASAGVALSTERRKARRRSCIACVTSDTARATRHDLRRRPLPTVPRTRSQLPRRCPRQPSRLPRLRPLSAHQDLRLRLARSRPVLPLRPQTRASASPSSPVPRSP